MKNFSTSKFKDFAHLLQSNWEYPVLCFLSIVYFNLNNKLQFSLDNLYLARNSDAWINFGFMLFPKNSFSLAPTRYLYDRLSWEFPGFILNSIFSPVQAHFLMHLSFLVIAIISFYYIASHFFSRKSALITTLLLISCTPFLIAMGSNYVDSPVITFFLLTVAIIVTTFNEQKLNIKMFSGGIFFASMIISQPVSFLIFIVPICGTYYLVSKNFRKIPHVFSLIYFSIGSLVTTAFFSIAFYFLTGSFSFLNSTLLFILKYNIEPNPWYRPWFYWLEPVHYLVLIIFILSIITCAGFMYKLKRQCHNPNVLFLLYIIVACSYFLFWQFKPNPGPMFKNIFVYMLIPLVFLSICVFLNLYIKKIKKTTFIILISFEVILMFSPYGLNAISDGFFKLLTKTVTKNFQLLIILMFIAFLLLIYLSLSNHLIKKQIIQVTSFFLCAVILINLMLFNIVSAPSQYDDEYSPTQFDSFENGFLAVTDTNKIFYTELYPFDQKRIWYNETEKDRSGNYYGGIFKTINYMVMIQKLPLPEYDLKNITKLGSNFNQQNNHINEIIFLSTDPDIFLNVHNEFQLKNQTITLVKEVNVIRSKINFNITVIKINPLFESENALADTNYLSPSTLKQIIASEYPEIDNQNITDWKKVNILRDWAYEHTDHTFTLSESLDSDPTFRYYQKNAPEIYSAFLNDQGGVACGGAAYALHQLYEMYGYQSYVVSVGDPTFSNHTSHAITLVQISQSGKPILSIQDAYFDLTITDENNSPVDFLEVVKLLNKDKYGSLNVLYGSKKPVDIIINKTSDYSSLFSRTSWRIVEDNKSINITPSLFKIKIQKNLERYEDSMRIYYDKQNVNIKSPYFNSTYPALSLIRHPFSIVHNQNPDHQLMKKVECIIDSNCIYEPLTEARFKQFSPMINITFDDDLKNKFEIHCVSGKCYKQADSGNLIYMPGSNSDYIVSKFISLPMNLTNEQTFVTSVTYDSTEPLTRTPEIYIQNSDYDIVSNDLNDYIFSNVSHGDLSLVNEFDLHPGDKSIRILIQSPNNQECLLPNEIEIYSKDL